MSCPYSQVKPNGTSALTASDYMSASGVWVTPSGGAGTQGPQGIQGDPGPQGIQGNPGQAGADGAAGADGQGVPTGGVQGQFLSKTSGANFATAWVASPSASVAWGGVTGTLSAQTDLQSALDGKAAGTHAHATGDITDFAAVLAGKAAESHVHDAAHITSGTIATARLGSGTASNTTFLRGDQTYAVPAGGAGLTFVRKTADESNTSNTTSINVADLGFSVAANTTYVIRYVLRWSAAATTTGLRLGCAGPTSPTSALVAYQMHLSADTNLTNRASSSTGFVDGALQGSGSLGTTAIMAVIEIMLQNGVNAGTVIPRFHSEVSGSAVTVFADSYGMMWQVA